MPPLFWQVYILATAGGGRIDRLESTARHEPVEWIKSHERGELERHGDMGTRRRGKWEADESTVVFPRISGNMLHVAYYTIDDRLHIT